MLKSRRKKARFASNFLPISTFLSKLDMNPCTVGKNHSPFPFGSRDDVQNYVVCNVFTFFLFEMTTALNYDNINKFIVKVFM